MKIDICDMEERVKINELPEITSPILFQHGDIPHPNGLISNEIFGVTTRSRRDTYAYIDLHGNFFNPHIYKAIRRMFRNIDKIVNGSEYYSLTKEGYLIQDPNGETGIEFLYNNWEKINWNSKSQDGESSLGMRGQRVGLINELKKKEVFMKYQIVIPAFYRDIKTGSDSNGGETDDLNNMYCRLIRLATLIKNQDMFDFQFNSTNYNIQTTILDIYDYFKHKLEKKNGLIRKYLMGRNVDYCTRTVITAPTYHADKPEDLFTDFRHVCIPIAQICSLAYPFVLKYIKDFFERELIDTQYSKKLYSPDTDEIKDMVKIKEPEKYYSDKYIKKMIDTFIKDPESRFTKIEIETEGNRKFFMSFNGKRMDMSNTTEISGIATRPMTWTDLLFIACSEVTKDKHVLVTRYPINDEFGVFVAKIRVSSTTKTVPMQINGQVYKFYPFVDLDVTPEEIGNKFIDATQFSNAYLPGIEGDYDGDQTTIKIIFTQEANAECEEMINKKSYFINAAGSNTRKVSNECFQTMFVLTKDPYGEYKALTEEEKKYFLSLTKEDLTFTKLVELFGNTTDIRNGDKTKKFNKSKYNVCDTLTIKPGEYKLYHGTEPLKTTVGRLIYNKILIESLNLDNIFEYQNKVMTAGESKKVDAVMANALRDDKITTQQMVDYIDTRDWFGLQFHAVITTSFTPGVLSLPKEVVELKKKLLAENSEAIKNGDTRVIEQIEGQLISKTKELLKDDIGMDLYNSGARGSVNNHLKNCMLMRGSIQNPNTKEYEIITNSLMDGLDKKDIPVHANMIVSGAYPRACGTAVTGYMSKELSSAMQTEVLGDKDSDCGTDKFITVTLHEGNYKDYIYRYVKTTKGLVMTTEENKNLFIGKTVKMRTPMYCVGVGKNKNLCNKCAGDFFYILGKKNIGLTASKLATALNKLGLLIKIENLFNCWKLLRA